MVVEKDLKEQKKYYQNIQNVKGNLSPIEEVESFNKEMIDSFKSNENRKGIRRKSKNRGKSRKKSKF